MIVELAGWLIIGLIVGLIARFLVPGADPMGCFATSLVGIAGAFVGGYLGRFFLVAPWRLHVFRPGFLTSLLGAIVVVLIVRMIRRR